MGGDLQTLATPNDAPSLRALWHPAVRRDRGECLYIGLLRFTASNPVPSELYEYFCKIGAPGTCIYVTFGAHDIVFRSWMHATVLENFARTIHDTVFHSVNHPTDDGHEESPDETVLRENPSMAIADATYLWVPKELRSLHPTHEDIARFSHLLDRPELTDGEVETLIRANLMARRNSANPDTASLKYFTRMDAPHLRRELIEFEIERLSRDLVHNVSVYYCGESASQVVREDDVRLYGRLCNDAKLIDPFEGLIVKYEQTQSDQAEIFINKMVSRFRKLYHNQVTRNEGAEAGELAEYKRAFTTTTLICTSPASQILEDGMGEPRDELIESQNELRRLGVSPRLWAMTPVPIFQKLNVIKQSFYRELQDARLSVNDAEIKQRMRSIYSSYLERDPYGIIREGWFLFILERDLKIVLQETLRAMGKDLARQTGAKWPAQKMFELLRADTSLRKTCNAIANKQLTSGAAELTFSEAIECLKFIDRGEKPDSLHSLDSAAEQAAGSIFETCSGSIAELLTPDWYRSATLALTLRNRVAHGSFTKGDLEPEAFSQLIRTHVHGLRLYMIVRNAKPRLERLGPTERLIKDESLANEG